MAITDLGDFTVASGAAKTVTIDPDDACEIKVANESSLTLQVQIGNDYHTIPAWTVDRFDLCGARRVTLRPRQIQSPAPNPPSSTLTITIATAGDHIPGTYPAALTRMASVYATQLQLANLVFPAGTSTKTSDVVPEGTHALMLINGDIASLNTLSVVGHTTGTNYLPIDKAQFGIVLGSLDIIVVPIAQVLDTQYDVIATNPTGASITLRVIAILDAQAIWVQSTSKQPVFSWDVSKPYDFMGNAGGAAGAQASVVAAASLQGRWMCSGARWSLNDLTAGGQTLAQILDGATTIFNEKLGVNATVGETDHAGVDRGGWVGTFNTSMTVRCGAGIANALEAVSCGLHLVGTR